MGLLLGLQGLQELQEFAPGVLLALHGLQELQELTPGAAARQEVQGKLLGVDTLNDLA